MSLIKKKNNNRDFITLIIDDRWNHQLVVASVGLGF